MVTGLGSFGLFLMVPLANHWLLQGGWGWAFEALAWTTLLMLFAALFLPDPEAGQHTDGQGLMAMLRIAAGHRGYLLLIGGFFVCGFHVAFIATHLPAYAVDMGLDRTTAGHALALIGLFNPNSLIAAFKDFSCAINVMRFRVFGITFRLTMMGGQQQPP